MKLASKVAVVTGGGSGIGRASALRFAREGARVAVIDRDGAAAEAVAGEAGGLALVGDVAEPARAEAAAAAILTRWGRIDVLLTAAGFSSAGTATSIAPADFEAVLRTNLWGTWLWLRAVLPAMQAAGRGSIITVASQLARAGGRNNVAYIAAKGAILVTIRSEPPAATGRSRS
jgi:2-keto-3-deoxy-L-fuconate dehydrogenase